MVDFTSPVCILPRGRGVFWQIFHRFPLDTPSVEPYVAGCRWRTGAWSKVGELGQASSLPRLWQAGCLPHITLAALDPACEIRLKCFPALSSREADVPETLPTIAEYRCPGQGYPISRAVHLGRLARFYPGCRSCPHADDTGTLSARHVQRLEETRPRGRPRPLFHEEGAGGAYLNDLGPDDAGNMAAALGLFLQQHVVARAEQSTVAPGADRSEDSPAAMIAGDGQPLVAELVAAVGEGLRWTGCHVVDIGPATAPCLALAMDHLRADGGILVGNPSDQAQTVGLKFWAGGPWPMSAGGQLDRLSEIFQAGVDRPTRTYGGLRRFRAEVPYLAGLAEYYHALRPLRLVLDTSCGPLARYLAELTEPVACRIIPCRSSPDRLAEQVTAEEAHFAASVGDDGQTCRVLDERGRPVPAERLLVLLARHLLAQRPQGTVVLEDGTSPEVVRRIEASGGHVVTADARRGEMAVSMREQRGIFGGGQSGCFWYDRDGLPLPDALMTLTWLLVLLSQSDRRFSEVLDREATVE